MARPLSLNSPWIAGRLDELDRTYGAHMAAGFPLTLEGNPEALQVVTAEDRTDWLTLLSACADAITAGRGGDPISVPIRCLSNNAYTVSFAECAQVMRDMRDWGEAGKLNLWRLKDLIRAAATREALMSIDLEEGWP